MKVDVGDRCEESTVGELRVEEPQLLAGAGGAVECALRVAQTLHLYFHGGEGGKHLLHALALLLLHHTVRLSLVALHPPALASLLLLPLPALPLQSSTVHQMVIPPPASQLLRQRRNPRRRQTLGWNSRGGGALKTCINRCLH